MLICFQSYIVPLNYNTFLQVQVLSTLPYCLSQQNNVLVDDFNIVFSFCKGARHTYSEAVGKNVANPTAMLLCSAKMLSHVNLQYYCDMIRNAVNRVLKAGKVGIYPMDDYSL